jgi:hypothetical protein
MIERFRTWLHRDCRRQRGTADALLEIGARLGELGRYSRELAAAVIERPAFVTVLVIGDEERSPTRTAHTAGEKSEPGAPIIFASSGKVPARGGQPISVEIHRPLAECCIVVLADLERVDVRGIFYGADVLTMAGPVAFVKYVAPGHVVRVLCELRGVGG